MKRIGILLLVMVLLCATASGIAETANIDLNSMSAEELQALKDSIDQQLKEQETQAETRVYGQGYYRGVGWLPEGKWKITTPEGTWCVVRWTTNKDENQEYYLKEERVLGTYFLMDEETAKRENAQELPYVRECEVNLIPAFHSLLILTDAQEVLFTKVSDE